MDAMMQKKTMMMIMMRSQMPLMIVQEVGLIGPLLLLQITIQMVVLITVKMMTMIMME